MASMDRKTIFLDHLILPRALKVLDRGVLIGEPPNLWLARDTDGDLRADTKELVTNNYGRLDANVEHNANSLLWALDNWMHTSETDIYLRLKKGAFEVRKTLARGQWGASQDDVGRIYRNSNESVLHVDLVPTPYFAQESEPAADARQLRIAARCKQRSQRRVAGASDARRQPRLPDRDPPPRRPAGLLHRSQLADGLSWRSPARRTARQHLRHRSRRQRRQPDRHQ